MSCPAPSTSPPASTTNTTGSLEISSLGAKPRRILLIAQREGLTGLPVVARLERDEQFPQQRIQGLPIARRQGGEHPFVTRVVGFDRLVNQPLAGSCERGVDCPTVLWMRRSADEAAFLELVKLRGHTRRRQQRGLREL